MTILHVTNIKVIHTNNTTFNTKNGGILEVFFRLDEHQILIDLPIDNVQIKLYILIIINICEDFRL